jgi:hypothetical protein
MLNPNRTSAGTALLASILLCCTGAVSASSNAGTSYRCLDAHFILGTGIPDPHAPDGKASQAYTFVAIDTVTPQHEPVTTGFVHETASGTAYYDPRSSTIGYVYETGNGTVYYNPRALGAYTPSLERTQKQLLEALHEPSPDTFARQFVDSGLALGRVDPRRLRDALHNLGLAEAPCVATRDR